MECDYKQFAFVIHPNDTHTLMEVGTIFPYAGEIVEP
jgi:hypothetical protein